MATPTTEVRPTQITIEAVIDAPVDIVWELFADPEHIVQWNAASDDWHTTKATNDLTIGGSFSSTMAAKDGSHSFDFGGTYTAVEAHEKIEYAMGNGRAVRVVFTPLGSTQTHVVETFDAEMTHSIEQQQSGWQAILDNFKKHVEAYVSERP